MCPRMSRFRTTELGPECHCPRCDEWWPADREFFYFLRGKPVSFCKACYKIDVQQRAKRRDDELSEVAHG